eukprot:m.128460 g.128460  ORF g.128460 m.128460 type:complete len:243 (+) comp15830_c0_seq2:1656-2384(+)
MSDAPRFVAASTYDNGTSINDAMSAFLQGELASVTMAVDTSAPVPKPLSKRSARGRATPPRQSKRTHRDHLDRFTHDGSNDGSNNSSDFESHSGAESSEGTSVSSRSTVIEPYTGAQPRPSAVRARDRASRRARRAVEASKPTGKKKSTGTLQSKDGARQRLKCLCKQYLTKFHAHPSSCVSEFLAWVKATKFKKADTRCNCSAGPAPTCDCIGCAHCRLERTVQLCQNGGMNWPHKATGTT